MLSHNQVKYINSLKIKKFRQQHKAFLIEGEKGVNELLASTLQVQKIFALPEWLEKNKKLIRLHSIEEQEITESELCKISDLVTPNQVLAIAETAETLLPEPSGFSGMALALDGIRDPGNMGTMIRTADWFGIRTIICSTDTVDIYNPKVIQATMGSFSRVSVYYTNLPAFFNELPAGFPVYGALLEGQEITQKTFTQAGIILIGSESHGISSGLLPHVNEPVHIPRFLSFVSNNQAESLNASVANGIICYEICKQLFKNNF